MNMHPSNIEAMSPLNDIKIFVRLRGHSEKEAQSAKMTKPTKHLNFKRQYEKKNTEKSPNETTKSNPTQNLNPDTKYTMFTCNQPSNLVLISNKPITGVNINNTLKTSRDLYDFSKSILKETSLLQFDRVYNETHSLDTIYKETLNNKIANLFKGKSTCFILFGPFNGGKSFALRGGKDKNTKEPGLLIRAVNDIFNLISLTKQSNINEKKNIYFVVKVSIYEVYLNKVYDLLSKNANAINIDIKESVSDNNNNNYKEILKELKRRECRNKNEYDIAIKEAVNQRKIIEKLNKVDDIKRKSNLVISLIIEKREKINNEDENSIAKECSIENFAQIDFVELASSNYVSLIGVNGVEENDNSIDGMIKRSISRDFNSLCNSIICARINSTNQSETVLTICLKNTIKYKSSIVFFCCTTPWEYPLTHGYKALKFANYLRNKVNNYKENKENEVRNLEEEMDYYDYDYNDEFYNIDNQFEQNEMNENDSVNNININNENINYNNVNNFNNNNLNNLNNINNINNNNNGKNNNYNFNMDNLKSRSSSVEKIINMNSMDNFNNQKGLNYSSEMTNTYQINQPYREDLYQNQTASRAREDLYESKPYVTQLENISPSQSITNLKENLYPRKPISNLKTNLYQNQPISNLKTDSYQNQPISNIDNIYANETNRSRSNNIPGYANNTIKSYNDRNPKSQPRRIDLNFLSPANKYTGSNRLIHKSPYMSKSSINCSSFEESEIRQLRERANRKYQSNQLSPRQRMNNLTQNRSSNDINTLRSNMHLSPLREKNAYINDSFIQEQKIQSLEDSLRQLQEKSMEMTQKLENIRIERSRFLDDSRFGIQGTQNVTVAYLPDLEIEKIKQDSATLKSNNIIFKEDINRLTDINRHLEDELAMQRGRNMELAAENERRVKEKIKLEEELQNANDIIQQSKLNEQKINENYTMINIMENQAKETESELSKIKEEKAKFEVEYRVLKEKFDDLKKQYDTLDNVYNNTKQTHENEIVKIEDKIDIMTREIEKLQKENSAMRLNDEKQRQEILSLEHMRDSYKEKYQEQKNKNNILSNKLGEIENEFKSIMRESENEQFIKQKEDELKQAKIDSKAKLINDLQTRITNYRNERLKRKND